MTPTCVLVAGPNGAGKSTSAPSLLRDEFGAIEFINADAIALGLSSFAPETVAVEAGRVLLRRFDSLVEAGATFAVETTLSGRAYARRIGQLKTRGYRIDLMFLWLPTDELAVARVANRVKMGGHNIPEGVIRRRYRAGLSNFFQLYRELVDSWKFYDNAGLAPRLVAHGNPEKEVALSVKLWHDVMAKWQ